MIEGTSKAVIFYLGQNMDRRRFLELMATLPALKTRWETSLNQAESGKLRPRAASAQPSMAEVDQKGFMLSDLLATRTVPLGFTGRHQFYVAADDIESEEFLGYIKEG